MWHRVNSSFPSGVKSWANISERSTKSGGADLVKALGNMIGSDCEPA